MRGPAPIAAAAWDPDNSAKSFGEGLGRFYGGPKSGSRRPLVAPEKWLSKGFGGERPVGIYKAHVWDAGKKGEAFVEEMNKIRPLDH